LQGTIPSIQNLHKSSHTGCGPDQLLLHATTNLAGVSKLRERWTRYSVLGKSRQRKRGDGVALFVSPNAEYVSLTVGNRIIILRKGDGYASPCGVYTSKWVSVMLVPAWLCFYSNIYWYYLLSVFSMKGRVYSIIIYRLLIYFI